MPLKHSANFGTEVLQNELSKLKDLYKLKKKHWNSEAAKEKRSKFQKKTVFMLSFINMLVMIALAFKSTVYYAYWNVFVTTALISHRYFYYKSRKWHYYLFDFCYMVNMLVNVYITVF